MSKSIKEIERVIAQGPYEPSWESISRHQMPSWYKQDKFGIFIHWGLYSVAAFNNEWYSRNMYIEDSIEFKHHVKTYGPHKEFGYQHFIPMFKAEQFDPEKWSSIIKQSGAKYVFQVAEHHDGFQMYKSDISHWNAFEMGPKRDILGELKKALEKDNIKFCTSSHRAEHWFFMSHGRKYESDISNDLKKGDFYWPSMAEKDPYDFNSEPKPTKEFLDDWLERTVEIIDHYHPSILYFDWWIQHTAFKPYLKKIAAYYFNDAENRGVEVAISYKHDAFQYGTGIIEIERGKFSELKHFTWQTETSIANNSWCYTDTLDYKSVEDVMILLIDVVSKNGNLLLNIGPKGDGSIPEYEENLLKKMGKWLEINGEAIYGSIPYLIYGEGPTTEDEGKFSEQKVEFTNHDFRFTSNHGSIYAFVLNPKNERDFEIKNLRKASEHVEGIFSQVRKVKLLGSKDIVEFEHTHENLKLHIKKSDYVYPICFKIDIE